MDPNIQPFLCCVLNRQQIFNNAVQADSTASWEKDKRKTTHSARTANIAELATQISLNLGKKKKSFKLRAQYKNNPCKCCVVSETFNTLYSGGATGHLETRGKKALRYLQ